MAYYTAKDMTAVLAEYPQYREKLYCRGFLITDRAELALDDYPFYGMWNRRDIDCSHGKRVSIIYHSSTRCYVFQENDTIFFLIGHAYNPYSMEYDEITILNSLSIALSISEEAFWKKESELTGVFCAGFIRDGAVVFSTDCTGMQLVYYGCQNGELYLTSHSKLVADLCSFDQDDYVRRLVNSQFYKYWGTFLPGDLSPFKELKRVVPNFVYKYNYLAQEFSCVRYFPQRKIEEINACNYEKTIRRIADVLERSLQLISMKWPNKRAAISVTGGRDSATTLASARQVYEKFGYFSYISNEAERIDADAAHVICDHLNLEHKIYQIPDDDELYGDIEIVKKILECNAGCIGHNNLNDVKKRIYLDTVDDFDIEVKSWVDELSRAEAQNKYKTCRFPPKPTAGYFRCMWKVIVNPILIHESNKVFKSYLERYYDKESLSYLPWTDYYYWEFSWSSGEGNFLTSEHKFSSDITVPYNNRCLLETMFTVPFEKRLNSQIQTDVIQLLDKRIDELGVHVINLRHTYWWSFMIRSYLKLFSRL